MSYRWHSFYLVVIAALLAALLLQGAQAQRAALAAHQAVAAAELYQTLRQAPGRYQVLDLRNALEFEDGHLPLAINIEPETLQTAALDRYRATVVVTEEGDREAFATAARAIKLAVNLEGGMTQWRMTRLPEVSGRPIRWPCGAGGLDDCERVPPAEGSSTERREAYTRRRRRRARDACCRAGRGREGRAQAGQGRHYSG